MTTVPKISHDFSEGEVIDMADFGRELLKRRADYEARNGTPCELPRNSGKRRTASKRALLKAIEEAGGKW